MDKCPWEEDKAKEEEAWPGGLAEKTQYDLCVKREKDIKPTFPSLVYDVFYLNSFSFPRYNPTEIKKKKKRREYIKEK